MTYTNGFACGLLLMIITMAIVSCCKINNSVTDCQQAYIDNLAYQACYKDLVCRKDEGFYLDSYRNAYFLYSRCKPEKK